MRSVMISNCLGKGWLIRAAAIVILPLAVYAAFIHLFERAAAERQVLSWVVAGKVVAIDPGHGGVDPGAVGPGGTEEKDITLAISQKLAVFLRQAGARVILTREKDIDLGTPGQSFAARKRDDLEKRLDLVRSSKSEVYINIQANAFGTRWTGAQTFFHPSSTQGRRMAGSIQKEIRRLLKNTNRVSKELDPYVLRKLGDFPAVMVEVGFLSNAGEESLLKDPKYQEELAFAIYAGVMRYLSGEDRQPAQVGDGS